MRKRCFLNYLSALVLILGASVNTCYADSSAGESDRSVQNVITHSSTKYNSLSLNQLRAIFSLRARAWPDGSEITVVVLKDVNPVHRSFLMDTLKMLPHQLRRQWDRYIYSGIGQGPLVVESLDEMLVTIINTPGAIGYVEGGVPDGQVITLSIR